LLDTPAIALVGSRELREPNRAFAEEVGRQTALQGLTLVSGNARGADKAAQNACLKAGGRVISVVADALTAHKPKENILYLSENSFDEGFSAQRALSRNRCIHALGLSAIAAQCSLQTGGTWDGSVKNLRYGWSPLYVFDDSSQSAKLLEQMGAEKIGFEALEDLRNLPHPMQLKL
jgi:predicted Rossmann fold nucleotide-binding protein DprA/Smf involved in DNA uptake